MGSKTKRKVKFDYGRRIIYKLRFLGVAICAVIGFLMFQTFDIQAQYGDEFERKAILQQVSNFTERPIYPNRGAIVDRNKNTQAFAVSTTVYDVFIDPLKILKESAEKQAEIIEKINKVLNIPVDELRAVIDDNPESQYKVIVKMVNLQTKEALEAENIKHLYFDTNSKRKYPNNDLAASVIGFIRGDSSWGLEAKFDSELSGEEGREYRLYDSENNAYTQRIDPIKGGTIVTTLDLVIQQEAQKLVGKYGEIAQAQNASLMVMNPNTGEILALAEYPSYDLNNPMDIESITSEYHKNLIYEYPEEERLNQLYKVWKNFSVIDTFEPGSIYKPLVMAAALEEGVINEYTTFYCNGGATILDTYVDCWHAGHGHQNYRQALANSCNVAIMEVASKLGRDTYYKYQCDFGIGSYSGIDLPGEPDTERLVHSRAALNPVELAVSGMGQGLTTTCVQMITAFSSVINGGNLMKPYVVSQIVDENDKIIYETTPTVVRKVISKETSEIMQSTMVAVLEPGGTGQKAAISGYRIGGKTGTGQQGIKVGDGSEDLVLSFMAYFPADNPEYIVLSVIDRSETYNEGNAQTLPMVKDMINFIISQKHISPDDSASAYSAQDDDTLIISDYIGQNVSQVTNSLNFYGFSYDVSGSGDIVKKQFPAAGAKVVKGSKIYLTVEQSDSSADLTLIPNVVGMTKEQAVETITASRLIPIVIDKSEAVEVEEGEDSAETAVSKTVVSQLPQYEIKVSPNTEIQIYIE